MKRSTKLFPTHKEKAWINHAGHQVYKQYYEYLDANGAIVCKAHSFELEDGSHDVASVKNEQRSAA